MTKGKLPRLPFVSMKDTILGTKYELSVVFATKKVSAELNEKYRGKVGPTNILSFALSSSSGELVLEEGMVRKNAPDFDMTYEKFLAYLLIHGMLHLKGIDHGSTMDREERKFLKKFS